MIGMCHDFLMLKKILTYDNIKKIVNELDIFVIIAYYANNDCNTINNEMR